MSVVTSTEYNLDLYIPEKKERLNINFFPHMKKEDWVLFENNRSLIS